MEDIVKVFTDVADLSSSSEGTHPKVSFGVKNFECDTIEELQQFGPKADVMDIYVGLDKQEVGHLEIARGRPASWYYGRAMRKDDRFKVYGQLHAIFHVRSIRWKAAVLSTPRWLFFLVIGPALVFTVRDVLADRSFGHQPHFYLKVAAFAVVWVLTSILLTYKTLYQQSFVVFRRVHDSQGLQRKWVEWRPYIIAAIGGGAAKELFDVIRKIIER